MGKPALLTFVDSAIVGAGPVDCRSETDLYSLRCFRHSRMAGISGGRHSEIALGLPGKLMIRLFLAMPATARDKIAVGAMEKLPMR